ncbi:MAG: transcriptional regulator GcvA [Burkholderiales bacterium]
MTDQNLPPLNPLRAFEAVARLLSFTAAAAELHVTQGAVSHQVRALEAWLGFKLFERSGRGLALTRGGIAYAQAVGGAFGHIAAATAELTQSRARQVLAIRGYTTFFVRWLIPRLPGFQADHPDIEIRLSSGIEPVDFQRDNADVGILYGGGRWRELQADLLFHDDLTPVLAPRLARTPGGAIDAEALAALPHLHLNARARDWPDWLALAGVRRPPGARDLYYEDLSIVTQCAIEGFGVALGQARYHDEDFAQGRLLAPVALRLRRAEGYFLVAPRRRADDPKVAAFRAWLLAQVVAPPVRETTAAN